MFPLKKPKMFTLRRWEVNTLDKNYGVVDWVGRDFLGSR